MLLKCNERSRKNVAGDSLRSQIPPRNSPETWVTSATRDSIREFQRFIKRRTEPSPAPEPRFSGREMTFARFGRCSNSSTAEWTAGSLRNNDMKSWLPFGLMFVVCFGGVFAALRLNDQMENAGGPK